MTHLETISNLLKEGAELIENINIISVDAKEWFEYDENILIKIDKPIQTTHINSGTDSYEYGSTQSFLVDYYSILSSLEQNAETSWLTPMLPDKIEILNALLAGANVSIIKKSIQQGGVFTRFGCSYESCAEEDITINMIVDIELSDFGRKVNEKLLDEFLHK